MSTEIKVLQHHIDQGRPKAASSCAIALAIREQFPDAEVISVGPARVVIDQIRYLHNAYEFVEAFDDRKPVSPRTVLLTYECGVDLQEATRVKFGALMEAVQAAKGAEG